MEESNQYRLFL